MRYVQAGSIGDRTQGHTDGVAALAFNSSGECLASAGLDAKLCIWNVEDGRLLHVFVAASPILSVAWVGPGNLLCGTTDGSISVITVSTGKLHGATFPRSHSFPVEYLGVQDGRLVSGAHEEVAVWTRGPQGLWVHSHDLPSPPANSNNQDRDVLVTSVCWTRPSRLLVTYMYHGYIIYDAKGWRRVLTIPLNGLIANASVTPDGAKLVVSNMMSGFDIYETDTGTSLHAIQHPVGELLAVPVMFAHGGDVILGGSAVGEAHIWDATTYDLVQSLPVKDSTRLLAIAAFHHSTGKRFLIATGLSDPGIRDAIALWDAEDIRGGFRFPSLGLSWASSRSSFWAPFMVYLFIGLCAGGLAIILGMDIAERPVKRRYM